MKHIAIIGSTGSIGTQALEVIAQHPERFCITALTAHNNADLLATQARTFGPQKVVIGREDKYAPLKDALSDTGIQVMSGAEALNEVVVEPRVDMVLTAVVGACGLRPTYAAIEAGKDIALANKETLVIAGELITRKAAEQGVNLIPVDSEHSAIYQCLVGESPGTVRNIILTASGGPFRGYTEQQLQAVTLSQALKHPNWSMGQKITIDSASMFNKGLELIEARWLFGMDNIQIVIHPQSVIHSLVEFVDGSLKAQLGTPDMRVPIQYALGWPDRLPATFPPFRFTEYPTLTFEEADTRVFRSLGVAYDVMQKNGNAACIMNAANEVAVSRFLAEEIRFPDIYTIVEQALGKVPFIEQPGLEDLLNTDQMTRELAGC